MSSTESSADSPSTEETIGFPTDTTLDDVDVFVIDHEDLEALVEAFGGPSAVPEALTIFTDDEFTRNRARFNLITFDEETFHRRPVTVDKPLHNHRDDGNTVADGRKRKPCRPGSLAFTEYLEALR